MSTSNAGAEAFIAAARRLHHDEGTLEIDDKPAVSRNKGGGDGAYVAAWVWVPNEEAAKEEE